MTAAVLGTVALGESLGALGLAGALVVSPAWAARKMSEDGLHGAGILHGGDDPRPAATARGIVD